MEKLVFPAPLVPIKTVSAPTGKWIARSDRYPATCTSQTARLRMRILGPADHFIDCLDYAVLSRFRESFKYSSQAGTRHRRKLKRIRIHHLPLHHDMRG